MKKLTIIISIMLLAKIAHADHHYSFSLGLSTQQSHYFTATSYIDLLPGFEAEPVSGHEIIFSIDQLSVIPPEEGQTGGPFANDDGVVGTLEGSIDISALGGALYTIPIELPLGLGDLAPSLGICYNSQGRNSDLGWGWSLAGLSSITRTGNTLYHDNNVSNVNFENDKFLLDGQRLLKISPTLYGGDGTVYRTEIDQLRKIISYQEDTLRGPAYFKVFDADGKIRYYGMTRDSRVCLKKTDAVCMWLLSRIEDRYGNYIEYTYHNNQHGYYLTQIAYSGNKTAHVDAQFHIVFSYEDRDDIETYYVGNQLLMEDKLLNRIQIFHDDIETSRYDFTFEPRNLGNGYPYPRLCSITYSRGKQHYNPTRIQWGTNNYPILSSSNTKKQTKTNGIEDAFSNAVKFCGDFNGDGYSDVISTQKDKNGQYSEAHLFLNQGGNQTIEFDYLRSFDLSQGISWIYVADFNGDGCDDVLFNYRQRNVFPTPDEANAVIYLSKANPNGSITFKKYETEPWGIYNDQYESLVIGDFHGDGHQSILYHSIRNQKSEPMAAIITYDKDNDTFLLEFIDGHLDARDLYAADINGDGISEIIYRKTSSTLMTKLCREDNRWHFKQLSSNNTGIWEQCFFGDYNGDGKQDILFYNGKASVPYRWFLSYGTGNGLSTTHYLRDPFPYTELSNDRFSLDISNETMHFIKAGDFDGNGCYDLVMRDDEGVHFIYGPFKEENLKVVMDNTQCVSTQLFSYYSNMDICLGNFIGTETLCFLGNHSISFLPPMTHRYEVRALTDGLGNKTELNYDYLLPNPRNEHDENFYCQRSGCTDHTLGIYSNPLPLRALCGITTYNVSGKPLSIKFHYEGALIHKRGKGIIGFSKIRQQHFCNHLLQNTIEKQFDTQVMGELIHVTLETENIYDREGNLMANSTPCYLPYTHEKNKKIFLPVLISTTLEQYDIDHPDHILKKKITDYSYVFQCTNPYQYSIPHTIQITEGLTDNLAIHSADACEFQHITTTSYANDNISEWIINRPQSVLTTARRSGDYDDVNQLLTYTYSSSKPYQILSERFTPNDGQEPNDPLSTQSNYGYDQFGHVTTHIKSAPFSAIEAQKYQYEYGKEYGYRLLTRETDPGENLTLYSYDPVYDHLIATTDCNGKETRYEQDPFGSTCWTFNPDGTTHCKATRWDNGIVIWEQKSGGRIVMTHHAITGEETETTCYNDNGDFVQSEIYYDDYGRVLQENVPHSQGFDDNKVRYTYDQHNRVQQIIHNDGTYEDIHYNGNNTQSTFFSLNKEEQSEAKTVNVAGWTVRSTDAEGVSVVYDHYADGAVKSAQIEGMALTRIEAAYDHAGNQVLLSDPNYGLVQNQYDAYGNLCQRISPKGDVTNYSYDILGRCTKRVRTTANGNRSDTTTWSYGDRDGERNMLVSIDNPQQKISYQYDSMQRPTRITDKRLDTLFTTHYSYDTASRVSSITYPSGVYISYLYSENGNIKEIVDDDGDVIWSTQSTTPLQQIQRCTLGNGIVSEYTYDEKTGRLTGIESYSKGNKIQDCHYTYDGFANISSRCHDYMGQSILEHFSYDRLNRLTNVSSNLGESLFTYDPLGRMTNKTSEGKLIFRDAEYNEAQPHAISTVHSTGGVFPQERMELSYTTFDRVASISESCNEILFEYGYDDYRTRMIEHLNGHERVKTYASGCEFIQEDGGEIYSRTFISGPTGIFAVVEKHGEKKDIYYILKDHLGSWTHVTDHDGAILQECSYDVWGQERNDLQPCFDRGFSGHEHIRAMGLINMNGRLYDPLTSSMLSPDNNIQMPDFSQNLNRYTYCLNNPLLYTDPDGESFISDALFVYFMLCTNTGYEIQKYAFHAALHIDLHLSTEQKGIGFDFSAGLPKRNTFSYQVHMGATYYWGHYDDSYTGFEFRSGLEITVFSSITYSTTLFSSGNTTQTTGALTLGSWLFGATYENDYMGFVGDIFMILPEADGGDRYRSAAAKIYFTELALGVNLFTGDPGVDHADRCTFLDSDVGGRETYCLNAKGDNPDEFRAGVLYFQAGPIRIGQNSEQIRNIFQNRFAHDFLCRGDSPYFKVLDREKETYFYFGTGTGNTLW